MSEFQEYEVRSIHSELSNGEFICPVDGIATDLEACQSSGFGAGCKYLDKETKKCKLK